MRILTLNRRTYTYACMGEERQQKGGVNALGLFSPSRALGCVTKGLFRSIEPWIR